MGPLFRGTLLFWVHIKRTSSTTGVKDACHECSGLVYLLRGSHGAISAQLSNAGRAYAGPRPAYMYIYI